MFKRIIMPNVLLVDDNKINLKLMKELLSRRGYQVTTAGNGIEALESARKNPPHIIVSDILMPEMDGFTLCRT